MTRFDRIREYFKENPTATMKEAGKDLEISYNTVRQCLFKDEKRGILYREDGKIIYDTLNVEDMITDYKPKNKKDAIRLEVVETLIDHMRNESDTDIILKFSKEIRLHLGEMR